MTQKPTYQVKAVKTFHGHDGYGVECKLYNPEGKFIAIVVDDGYGGGLQYYWEDEKAPSVECKSVDYNDEPTSFRGTPFEAALNAHCLSLPKYSSKWDKEGEEHHVTPDIFCENLWNTKLTEKEVKKLTKKVAVLNGTQIITWKCGIDHPQVSKIRDHIAEKYPNGIILNDLPLDKAVEAYEASQHL